MKTSRTAGRTVEGSISYGGESHTSPLWLLATAGVAGFFWFLFSTVQITSTIQTVYNFLQTTVNVTPGMTAQDLLKLQQGNLGSDELIANAIGWSIQLALLVATFPSEHYITAHLGRARKFVMGVLIGADWLTDSLFVLGGHTIFNGFALAHGALGVVVIAIIYPIALTSVTVFAGVELAHRIDKLASRLRNAVAS